MHRYGGTSCSWINRGKQKNVRNWDWMMATLKGKFLLVDYLLNLLRLQDLK
jgi:hypothetical protein